MQTDIMDKSNFKKPGVHWSAAGAPGLLIYDTWQCKATLYIFLCLVLAKKLQLFQVKILTVKLDPSPVLNPSLPM